jgi:hypothetical protein
MTRFLKSRFRTDGLNLSSSPQVRRKAYPPIEQRIVRRLVEKTEFIVPHARVVRASADGGVNAKLNELSDKDLMKLLYTWQMPRWTKVYRDEAICKLSPASLCHKSFVEVQESLEDLCIPEYFSF